MAANAPYSIRRKGLNELQISLVAHAVSGRVKGAAACSRRCGVT